MRQTKMTILVALLCSAISLSDLPAAVPSPLLEAMKTELDRSFQALSHADSVPMYYLAYQVSESDRHDLYATYGAVTQEAQNHQRILDIDLRVGDYKMDNTREIRGDFDSDMGGWLSPQLPLEDDPKAIRAAIWLATDQAYKNALERYTKIKTNQQVMVEQEDTASDFSVEKPNQYIGETVSKTYDVEKWKERLRRLSAFFKEYQFVRFSAVNLLMTNDNRYFVDSDGGMIQTGQSYARLQLYCSATAEDGMQLSRSETFDASSPEELPTDEVAEKSIRRLTDELDALLEAPLAQPYTGPAILFNRAAGVFFHEIFGHRIEGHRQKSETEGQTFAKKVGERILPDFISVLDDPTRGSFNGTFLRGHYLYDDQGVKTTPVTIVDKGILRNFLMSRSPVGAFDKSNGHGRRQAGRRPVSRQGNLIIESTKTYPFEQLVEMLKEECRKQGKPYGLVFYDISGGFTQTGRWGAQAFKVIPLLVYRYYTDGREPELIRGVDIVGTPLTSFARITATSDDYVVFNGTCGAESGFIPVSATAPSVLVSEVEIAKKMKEQEKPPVLDPPYQPVKPKSIF